MTFSESGIFKISILILILSLFESCQSSNKVYDPKSVPEWSKSAIYYQIFVERFRNGDPSNDPTPDDILMTYPENIPSTWQISDWTAEWYKPDSYHDQLPEEMDFYTKVQMRRYGGDLQGVLDQIDYIDSLGVNAVYFNPLNDAPSLHKYDPRNYRHIDRNFGADPIGDIAIIASEIPDDPSTWKWTSADKLFLDVIKAFHSRGIRVILDYSFNHSGYDFWAVNDIRKNGKNSKYVDWYDVKSFDDPTTPENETEIEGWWGFKYLPLYKEKLDSPDTRPPHEGNIMSSSLKQHLFNVSRRWLDPDGDGSFDDGVDGYRMDVASEVSMGFWREYRQFVKSVNPDALLIGEVWWFDYPDLSGPEKMAQGDSFDGLMNYRWYLLARGFFSQGAPVQTASQFVEQWTSINKEISFENQQAMMNVAGTHDTPRLSTCFFNDGFFNDKANPKDDPEYKTYRPDEKTWKEVKMMLLHQFTFVGAPNIWNGDELGMWGAKDPDNRKPLWWPDMTFDFESVQAFVPRSVAPDSIRADLNILSYYQQLIDFRISNPTLCTGNLTFTLADDAKMCLAYSRSDKLSEIIVVFNRSEEPQKVQLPVKYSSYKEVIGSHKWSIREDGITVELGPLEGTAFRSVK